MKKFAIKSIGCIIAHKHTNPDGSTIMIRALKHVYFVDSEHGPFIVKKDKRIYLSQEEADKL